jgi:GTP-binding protein HflX
MRSLDELARLLETAGGSEAARVIQNRVSPDKATYIGSGKVREIAEFVRNDGDISLVIFDNELTPSQIANLEREIEGARVIDRTMLILDIFALHAVTGEGKLQVEIACLRYTAPRLTGRGKELSRLGGGIGTRGPGESKLESDRRHIKRRIAALSEEIAEIERTRSVKRATRLRSGIKSAAIIGYTNAGKSTLLNTLTDAGILAEDKLFATLDPTTRRLTLPSGTEILLTDTVGFIDRLPTHLVKAFKSTLEELKYADYIILITDASEELTERERKRDVTKQLIAELGAATSR